MPLFTLKQPQLFYQLNGEGFPVVFLHGFCEDQRIWHRFFDSFPGCQLICIDLPGFGRSPVGIFPDLVYMADLVSLLLKQLGIEKCILIGHSMGGYVSLAFAEKYEHLLSGLALFHSSPYADSNARKEKRLKEIQFIDKNGHHKYIAQLLPKLFPESYDDREVIRQLINKAQQYNPEGIKDGLIAMMNRPDRSDVLKNFSCPVLTIAGGEDQVVPMEKSLQFSSLPNISMMHFLPDVAHMGMIEAPKLCHSIIDEFIAFCQ